MLILFSLTFAFAQDSLELKIEGLESAVGPVICTLYDREDVWLKDAGYVATSSVPVADGQAVCRFEAVTPGTYAISFIQDVNNNDKLDTNLIGFPKEPWGVSRDAPVSFGPPKFADAVFTHPGAPQVANAR